MKTTNELVRCHFCPAVPKTETHKCPPGWKRVDGAVYCPKCFHDRYHIVAVTLQVLHPVPQSKELTNRFWEKLRGGWAYTTRVKNWIMQKLAASEKLALPGPKMLGAFKDLNLSKKLCKFNDLLSGASVDILHQQTKRHYKESRFAAWSGKEAFSNFRYPQPYPIRNQSWDATYLSETEKVPVITGIRVGGETFSLRLKGSPRFAYHLKTFGDIVEGRAIKAEMALMPRRRKDGTGHECMAKLVVWLPKAQRQALDTQKTLVVATDDNSLLSASINDNHVLNYNADYLRRCTAETQRRLAVLRKAKNNVADLVSGLESQIKRLGEADPAGKLKQWIASHQRRLERLREDAKAKASVSDPAKFRDKILDKQHDRYNSAIQMAVAWAVNLAARRRCGVILFDMTKRGFAEHFQWFKLKDRMEKKCNALGIILTVVGYGDDGEKAKDASAEVTADAS